MKQITYAAIAVIQMFIIVPATIEGCLVISLLAMALAVVCTVKGELWEMREEGSEE